MRSDGDRRGSARDIFEFQSRPGSAGGSRVRTEVAVSEARPRGPRPGSPAGGGRGGRATLATTRLEEIGEMACRIPTACASAALPPDVRKGSAFPASLILNSGE